MPFKSDKQRKYLFAKKPEVAKKLAKKHAYGGTVSPGESVAGTSSDGTENRHVFKEGGVAGEPKVYNIDGVKKTYDDMSKEEKDKRPWIHADPKKRGAWSKLKSLVTGDRKQGDVAKKTSMQKSLEDKE